MLIDDFKKEKIVAMKAHDADAVAALNVIITKLMLIGIEKRTKGEVLTEADTTSVIQKSEKELEEEREGYASAGRTDNVRALDAQLAVIRRFKPQLMSEEEIASVITSLDDKSVPSVMKHFKTNYAGKCDMKLVNTVLAKLK